MANLPEKFITRMKSTLGSSYADYERAMNESPSKALHLSSAVVGDREDYVVDRVGGLQKLPFPLCYAVGEGRPASLVYHAVGAYYIQEPSAMLPVASVDIPRGAKVLDMCASPGGKSSLLASRMKGDGLLVSNEIDRARALVLRENLVRTGYVNTVITNMRPTAVADTFGGFFDVVLVDAPCSGEGMFRKEAEAVLNWSEANVKACAHRQKEIVKSADECLKEGGTLVYSTCTFSKEEDEEVVDYLLSIGYELISPPEWVEKLGVNTGKGYKFYPHIFGEGQFFALLRKTGDSRPSVRMKKQLSRASSTLQKAVSEVVTISGVCQKDDMLFLPALGFDLPCLMNGVLLGKTEKGRFIPSHNLFSALGSQCINKLDLAPTDPRLSAYLRGEEISALVHGWCAVLADGFPLGGGKGSGGGVVKNHYPKNLRKTAQ